MFALQEHRSIAGVVSIIVHAGVVAAAIAGARHMGSDMPPMAILADSVWVMPTAGPAGGVAGPAVPLIDPVDVPNIPGMPAADGDIVDPVLTDEPPVLLSAPVPAYPPLLRQAGIQGWVTVQTVIDTLGRAEPVSLRVVTSPNPGFDRPALDCVRRALFRPGRVHGRAVRVLVSLPLHFTLRP